VTAHEAELIRKLLERERIEKQLADPCFLVHAWMKFFAQENNQVLTPEKTCSPDATGVDTEHLHERKLFSAAPDDPQSGIPGAMP